MPALLIILGAIIVVFNVVYILRKEEVKEEAFSLTYDSSKSNIKEEKLIAYELREEFSETILELQLEIESLKDKITSSNNSLNAKTTAPSIVDKKEETSTKKVSKKNKISSSSTEIIESKTEKIKKLLLENKTVDEISEELLVGKGEVLLIKELYLK